MRARPNRATLNTPAKEIHKWHVVVKEADAANVADAEQRQRNAWVTVAVGAVGVVVVGASV